MTPKPRIVIAVDIPPQWRSSPQLDRLRRLGEVAIHLERPATLEEQIDRVRDAEVVITPVSALKWPAETLKALPDLKLLVLVSIGTDSVDLEQAKRQGLRVCNVPGRTAPMVAEHALALMLAVAKRVVRQTAAVHGGRWAPERNVLLQGKTLGIVGTGHSGAKFAKLAKAIGMEVIAWTFNPSDARAAELGLRYVGFDDLLQASDAVSLHVRLTGDTRHLIGRRELGLMRPGALLVNVARGGVVDPDALVEALQSGHLAGAGLDVFEPEPIPAGHPILDCENVVLTAHVADNTPEGMEFLNEGAVDNVAAFLEGRPQNVVV